MLRIYNKLIFLFTIIIFAGCSSDNNSPVTSGCEDVYWTYSNQENWASLCNDFSPCASQRQSPINISGATSNDELPDLEFNYSTTSTQIENDGHAIKFICDGGSSLKIGEMNYQLLELHYHSASEHQIEGQNYPLEVHFVHKASETDLAVVGIIFEEGAENELFSRFLSNFPLEKGSYSDKSMINLIELIPENKSYYHYEGSLTTPPCSETVSWYVLKERLTASAEQISQFSAILKNNYRYVQNLYGRVIYGKGS